MLTIHKDFSNNIDKCTKAATVRDRLRETTSIKLDIDITLKELDPQEAYIRLDINGRDVIGPNTLEGNIKKKKRNKKSSSF